MNPFRYVRAGTLGEAASAGSADGAHYIAGGTNVLDLMKDAVERPSLLIDINALPMREIELRENRLWIGALARMSEVAAHSMVRQHLPAVTMALNETASAQLRNMGSIGGNLLQRTRCPYFRDPATPCNKRRPGSGCGAIGGENRAMAILGTSDQCIATHASDLAVALVAYGAIVHISGVNAGREVPIERFYRLPGTTPNIETELAHGELITAVTIPLPTPGSTSTYVKVRDRAQYEFALASAGVVVKLARGGITSARIALGGIATVPWRARGAERVLSGAAPTRATFQNAAGAAVAGARGYGQNDFKITLAARTLVRALENAVGNG